MRDQLFLFLVIILLTFQKDLSAQAYRPMAVEGATWIYAGYGESEGQRASYHISGDTTIENKIYKNVWAEYGWIGYMRDDSLNRKVYGGLKERMYQHCDPFFLDTTEVEKLLYDFDLTVGDTIVDACINDFIEIEWDELEYFLSDFWRVIGSEPLIVLYEGLGTNYGLFYQLGTVGHAGKGLALVEYCISDNGVCTTTTHNTLDDSEIKVYPNPSSDIINITTEKTTLSTSIYDLTGRRLLHNQNQKIDLSPLNPGPYLIEVILSDQYVYRTKIIKI